MGSRSAARIRDPEFADFFWADLLPLIINKFFGSREESGVAGLFVFSHLRMMGYFRLCKGYIVPLRVRAPAGARNRRKHM